MIEIYCDGGCSGNPGPAGWGYLARYNNTILDRSCGPVRNEQCQIVNSTNQAAELLAFLMAIRDYMSRWISLSSRVMVISDSAYLLNGLREKWYLSWRKREKDGHWCTSKGEPVCNEWIWRAIVDNIEKLEYVGVRLEYIHVKGHSGHPFNEEADKLAGKGVGMAKLALDKDSISSVGKNDNV